MQISFLNFLGVMPADSLNNTTSTQGNKDIKTGSSLSLFDEIEKINSKQEIPSNADKSLNILGLTVAYSLLLNFFNIDKE